MEKIDPMIPYAMYNWTNIERAPVIMIKQLNGRFEQQHSDEQQQKIFDNQLPFGFIDQNRIIHLWLPWRHSIIFLPYLKHLGDSMRLPMAEISMKEYFQNCPKIIVDEEKNLPPPPQESKANLGNLFIRYLPLALLVLSLLMIMILCGGKGKKARKKKKKNKNKSAIQMEMAQQDMDAYEQLAEQQPEQEQQEQQGEEQQEDDQQQYDQQQVEVDADGGGVGYDESGGVVTDAENKMIENEEINPEQQQPQEQEQQQDAFDSQQPQQMDNENEIKMKMMKNRMKMGKDFDFGKATKHLAKILVGKNKSQTKTSIKRRISSAKSSPNDQQQMFSDYDRQQQ
ncbi:hypothetical protein BLA29_003529, partial [Euroglyphus maynei]